MSNKRFARVVVGNNLVVCAKRREVKRESITAFARI